MDFLSFEWLRQRFQNAQLVWRLLKHIQDIIQALEAKNYPAVLQHAKAIIAMFVNDRYEAAVFDLVDGGYKIITAAIELYQKMAKTQPDLLVSAVENDLQKYVKEFRYFNNLLSLTSLTDGRTLSVELQENEEAEVRIDPVTVIALIGLLINTVRLIIDIRRRRNAHDDYNPFAQEPVHGAVSSNE